MYNVILFRPLSSPHDIIQLMGRGGRGPNIFSSSLDIVWNKNDIANNVPGSNVSDWHYLSPTVTGMTSEVRWLLESDGCIVQKLCDIFEYRFSKLKKCCSNCEGFF